ncbi:hypothetical protein I302_105750 [Kwoniella bestiolae CBS 10118]|uniref:Uncharacterized protein n=1 Tax=Kwoniella bestiolae CBS 10118 TaxID=1296100 RepID=A0A1B9G209_9TREE|nr:hypothetical protein I302_04872 [Kwoniella bestiolae CBS 10118]OCF25062.1 hypothetical protein I302_04872 [Kwoniella bestiolae CBS 10118]
MTSYTAPLKLDADPSPDSSPDTSPDSSPAPSPPFPYACSPPPSPPPDTTTNSLIPPPFLDLARVDLALRKHGSTDESPLLKSKVANKAKKDQ